MRLRASIADLTLPAMSIATKTGDLGTTGLMYNRRVSKCHPRVEAVGCVDELNSALGLARALLDKEDIKQRIYPIQKDLITLMGELATAEEDSFRYRQDGFPQITAGMTARLDQMVKDIEAQQATFQGWAIPGANAAAAALDVARTTCRRAERRVCALAENNQSFNPEVLVYLNRLSDVLWLLARSAEGGGRNGVME
jgi:cob(I)alamin adenosyltransferase